MLARGPSLNALDIVVYVKYVYAWTLDRYGVEEKGEIRKGVRILTPSHPFDVVSRNIAGTTVPQSLHAR